MAESDLSEAERSLDLPGEMFRAGAGEPQNVIATMYRRSLDPEGKGEKGHVNVPVTYTEIDGMAVFEGDIILSTAEEAKMPGTRGVGLPPGQFRWPGGVVPYEAEEAVRAKAEAAIAHWEAKTPFRFPKHTGEEDFISFVAAPPSVCQSRVGMRGGGQPIRLGANCSVGSAIHEIGHAVGLWHEQSREDRDEFVTIVEENIDPNARGNFEKQVQNGDDLGEYDYASIMHYPRTAFSINNQDTIVPKDPSQPIGQRNGLSARDVASLQLLYPDLDWPAGDAAGSSAEEAGTRA